MPNLSGQSLGRYHLIEQLGEGGMAVVYRAYDTRLERDVAVKIIRQSAFPPDIMEGVLKRFDREAKSLARLSHLNIVKVYDFGDSDGSPFLVLEYLSGGTLKDKLGKPIPWAEAIKLIMPVARGLAYAHERGIIHRDIKPANILITENGEPMLSDFGIAKILEIGQNTLLTGTGMAIGTPEYMAPEQWNGKTSPQSDLYSLGIVFFELITGRKPYVADTPAAILLKQATEPLPRPCLFAPDLPEAVERILIKALAREPENRYQSINAFIDALENLTTVQPASATTPMPDSPETIIPLSQPRASQLEEATIRAPIAAEIETDGGAQKIPDIKSKLAKIPMNQLWVNSIRTFINLNNRILLVSGLILILAVIGVALVFRQPVTPVLYFWGNDTGKTNIYAFDGKILTKITQSTGDVRNWSPVGGLNGMIYFVSDRDGQTEIYRINGNGNVERVTNTPGHAGSWSPATSLNGRLYFVSDRDGKVEIYRINQAGEIERVTNTPGQAGSWSPASSMDGKLYFVSNREGKVEIYRINQTGTIERVTHTPGMAGSWSPAIGPNGDLYFTSDRDGKAEIYKINQAGSIERITNTPGQAKSWAPVVAGGHVYFTSDRSGRAEVYDLGTKVVAISNLQSWTSQDKPEKNNPH